MKTCIGKDIFLLSTNNQAVMSHQYFVHSLGLYLNYTNDTKLQMKKNEENEVIILGLCIDSHREFGADMIAEQILNNSSSINEVYSFCDRLAGKFIIILSIKGKGYIFGDATCTMPINYVCAINKGICVASTDKMVAENCNCNVAINAKMVRKGTDNSQTYPAEMTLYEDVKALLPNHYLDLSTMKSVRVSICDKIARLKKDNDQQMILSKVDKLIDGVTEEYLKYKDIICALTSGYDSRLVFSYLKRYKPQVQCYTYYHKGFNEETDDLYVPKQICEHYNQPYVVIKDEFATKRMISDTHQIVGEYMPDSSVSLVNTLKTQFIDKAIVNGDIAGQIGKASLFNNVPYKLISSSFLRCKLHNVSKECLVELRKYKEEIQKVGDKEEICDLFAMETRCGRWASQTGLIYGLHGIDSLNIFNCREIIFYWIALPRRYRSKGLMHKSLIEKNDKYLVSIPFNPGCRFDFFRENWILYFIATFGKQFVLRIQRLINGRREEE